MRHQFRFSPRLEVLEDRLPPGGLWGGHADRGKHDHAAVIAALAASAHGNNPDVFPVQSSPHGKTYAEWSAAWWQWHASLSVDHHPLYDTADCSTGQSGRVWFLGGTFTTVTEGDVVIGEAERDCTIPSGTALFFPILNYEASVFEGNGTTEAELRDNANFVADHMTDLTATLDGRAIGNLSGYRVESPLFTMGPMPANNAFGAPEGTTTQAVSDGYFLMLKPLPVGSHTLHFSGSVVFTEENDGFDFRFELDITYHITVAPRGS